MGVLWWIGRVLLWLLAGVGALLALLVLLLCLPVLFSFAYDGDDPRLTVRIVGIPLRLLPARPRPEKSESSAADKPGKKKESVWQTLTRQWKSDGAGSLVSLYVQLARWAGQAVGLLLRVPVLREVYVHLHIAAEEPDQTALRYGGVCAVLHPAQAVLREKLRIRKADVQVDPDFCAVQSRAQVRVRGHIWPWRLIGASVVLLIQYVLLILQVKKQEE